LLKPHWIGNKSELIPKVCNNWFFILSELFSRDDSSQVAGTSTDSIPVGETPLETVVMVPKEMRSP